MERLKVLEQQLTTGQADNVDGYTISLPERLEPEGMWTVRRWLGSCASTETNFSEQLVQDCSLFQLHLVSTASHCKF